MDEAEALLHHAGRCYGEIDDSREGAVCFALLGLLYIEEEEVSRAEKLLRSARPGLDARIQPWLAAESYLALARCLALTNREPEARKLRESALGLNKSVPGEGASLVWREAQVADALGELANAEQLFELARRRYLEWRCLPEAGLATIDLARVLVRQDRREETRKLSAELVQVFEGQPGLELSLSVLQGLEVAAVTGNCEEEIWRFLPPALLLSYRIRGIYSQPVPCV
jgi:tetratricopeptide (TPR) repeat protein